jgi:hypothetical protein
MTVTYEMTGEQFREFVNGVRREVTDVLASQARKNAPEATKMLTNSIRAKNRGAVGSDVVGPKYAMYVNYGTGPRNKLPPWKPIADWVDAIMPGATKEQKYWKIKNTRELIMLRGTPSNPFISEKTLRQDLPRFAPGIILNNLNRYGKQV